MTKKTTKKTTKKRGKRLHLIDFILKKTQNIGDEIIIRLEKTTGNSFLMKNGQIENYDFNRNEGINVLAITKNGARAFISTNILEKTKISKELKKLGKQINKQESIIINQLKKQYGKNKIKNILKFNEEQFEKNKKTIKATDMVKQKKKIQNISLKEKIEFLKDIQKSIEEANKKEKQIKILTYLNLIDIVKEKLIIRRDGTKIKAIHPQTDVYYFITGIKQNKSAQRYWQYGQTGGWEGLEKQKLNKVLNNETKSIIQNLNTKKKIKQGKYDVIVAPEVVGIMVHESVGHPYEADRILGREMAQAGGSFVTTNMLNTQIGSEIPSVSDDPRIKNSFGYYLYDDEGFKATEKKLMVNGRINEFLQNSETSLQMSQILGKKIKNNGGSRAESYINEPIVRMSNTYLKKGDYTEDELIKETKKGIYIKNFTEWNIDDMRLSQKYVGFEAYLIKNGKIIEPIKSPVIEITTPKLWSSVSGVAKNLEFHAGTCGKGEPMQGIPVWFGGPSMKLKNIVVYSNK